MPNLQTRGQAAVTPTRAVRAPIMRGTGAVLGAPLLALMLSACGPKEEAVTLSEPTVEKEMAIVLNQTEQVAEDVSAQAGRVAYEADIDAAAERRAAIRRDARLARAEAARDATDAEQAESPPQSLPELPPGASPDRQSAPMAANDLPPTAAGQPADTTPPVDDAVITARIEALIEQDTELAALDIDVATLDGKVILNGTAPSEALRARAAELAVTIDGVIGILNQVIVKPA